MREKFQLCCRVVGLVLLCWGILSALSMIPVYFHQPKADMFIPQSMLGGELGQRVQRALDEAVPRMYAWITVQMFLQGIAPALLGLYLMRSNNVVMRACYPESTKPGGELRMDLTGSANAPASGSTDDAKYAPPGSQA